MPTLRVFFATNRRRAPGPTAKGKEFEGAADPAAPKRLALGFADLAVTGHTEVLPTVETVKVTAGDPDTGLPGSIAAGLRAWLDHAAAAGAMPLLFVHGFQNSFADALGRAAQIAAFYARAEPKPVALAPLVFTWPSPGVFSAAAYKADQASAAAAGPALARLIRAIAAIDPEPRFALRLLAHSMGNWCLQHAVQALAGEAVGVPQELFRCAVLAAADTEADALCRGDRLGPLARMADRITVAVHPSDPVLCVLSKALMENGDRLGLDGAPEGSAPPANVQVVDYANCVAMPGLPGVPDPVEHWKDATWNAVFHQYYRNNVVVRDDLARALRLEDAIPGRRIWARGAWDNVAIRPRSAPWYAYKTV